MCAHELSRSCCVAIFIPARGPFLLDLHLYSAACNHDKDVRYQVASGISQIGGVWCNMALCGGRGVGKLVREATEKAQMKKVPTGPGFQALPGLAQTCIA